MKQEILTRFSHHIFLKERGLCLCCPIICLLGLFFSDIVHPDCDSMFIPWFDHHFTLLCNYGRYPYTDTGIIKYLILNDLDKKCIFMFIKHFYHVLDLILCNNYENLACVYYVKILDNSTSHEFNSFSWDLFKI